MTQEDTSVHRASQECEDKRSDMEKGAGMIVLREAEKLGETGAWTMWVQMGS